MSYEKICPVCGKTFEAEYKRTKWCSAECKRKESLEYCKKWHADHREEHNKLNNAYGRAHKEEQKEALKRFYAKHPSYMQEYFKKKADEMGVTLTDYHKYKRTDLYVRKSKEAKIPTKVYKKLYQQVSGRNRHEQIIKLWSITQEV